MIHRYSGRHESPGKVAARAVAYGSIKRKFFWTKKHIVIASRECGDIRYLLERGVPPKNIIACDTDSYAIIAAANFGVALAGARDIAKTVTSEMKKTNGGNHIVSINVDLCGSLVTGLPVLLDVCEGIPYSYTGYLFFTFDRARDQRYHLNSTKERIKYLAKELKTEVNWNKRPEDILRDSYEYVSFTKRNQGSPMMMANLSLFKGK